jgi:predicted phage tail protein
MMISPHKFGRRVAALWRTVNRCAAVAEQLEAARRELPTRWQRKQITKINNARNKLAARAARQAAKLAEVGA